MKKTLSRTVDPVVAGSSPVVLVACCPLSDCTCMVFGGNAVLVRGIDTRPMHRLFPSASVRTERWRGGFSFAHSGKGGVL